MIQFLTGLLARIGALFRARPKSTGTGLAAMLAAAAIFVAPWEGERTEAYLDRIASPPVWTVCYGETKGVKQGDSYTPQQCLDMLSASLAGYRGVSAMTEKPTAIIPAAFEDELAEIAFDRIIALKQLPSSVRLSRKFDQIASTVESEGLVEPPVVARCKDDSGQFLLLDGHARIEVLKSLGKTSVRPSWSAVRMTEFSN